MAIPRRRGPNSAIVLTMLLAACQAAAPSIKPQDTVSPAAATPEKVTVTYWGLPDWEATEKPILDAFMVANPEITVVTQRTPFADYTTALTTALRAGGGPDIAIVNHTDIQTYALAGFLVPLDDYEASGALVPQNLIPGLVDAGKVSGKQFTLPLTTDNRVLFYNPSLFKAAGIVDASGAAKPPATWDELKEDLAKFKQTGAYAYAYPAESDYSMAYDAVGPYMVAAGGSLLTTSAGKTAATAGTDQGTIDALNLIKFIRESGTTPPGQGSLDSSTIAQLFGSNKLAMFIGGPWNLENIKRTQPDLVYGDNYASAAVPVPVEGMPSGSTAGGWHLGVFAHSAQKDAAVKLMNYLLAPDTQTTLNAGAGSFPTFDKGLEQSPWSDDPFYKAYGDALPHSRLPILPVQQLPQVAAAFEKYALAAVEGGLDAKEQLSLFDTEVNEQILP